MGVGALQVLAERGTLPPAIGMAVFGDLPIVSPTPLGITVISLPARHLGVTAADLLLERINGDDQPRPHGGAAQPDRPHRLTPRDMR